MARGENPYTCDGISNMIYIYPQFLAYCFSPFASHSIEKVFGYWLPLNWLMHVATISILLAFSIRSVLNAKPTKQQWFGIGMLAFVSLGFSPTLFGLRLGQLDVLVCFVFSLFFLASSKWRPWVGGVLLGVAVLLKVSPVLLAPVLILAFGWRFLVSLGLTLLAYIFVLWSEGLLQQETDLFTVQIPFLQFKTNFPTISLYYFISIRLFGETFISGEYYKSWLTSLMTLMFLGTYAVLGLRLWWKNAHWFSLLTVGVVMSHVASPFLEPHHFTMTLIILIPWTVFLCLHGNRKHLFLVVIPWLAFMFYLTASEMYYRPGDFLIFGELMLLAIPFLYPSFSPSGTIADPIQA